MQSKEFREKERERSRNKYSRFKYKGRSHHAENIARYFRSRGIILKGCEFHHWNYNLLTDVIVLPKSIHRKLHKDLVFDEETKQFIHDGKLLSKEDHIQLINSLV